MVIHLNRIHAKQIKRSIKFVYTSLMSTVGVMLPKHFLKNFYPLFLFPSVCSDYSYFSLCKFLPSQVTTFHLIDKSPYSGQ